MEVFDEKATINRIIQLRKQFSGQRGKSKFARQLGIGPSTYSYYENDRLAPISILLKICQTTGCDLHWLLTGQNKNSVGSLPAGELTDKIAELLESNPKAESALMAFIELLSEKKDVEKRLSTKLPTPSPAKPNWIPVLGRTAAGIAHFWDQTALPEPQQMIVQLDELVEKYTGRAIVSSLDGDLTVDFQLSPAVKQLGTQAANLIQVSGSFDSQTAPQAVQFVQCRQVHELFPDAFALQIDGDSMAPRINDGDIVILSPSVPAAQGQVAVVRLTGQIGVTCKLIRTTQDHLHFIPTNEKYEVKVADKKNLLWALAVLCHMKV
jgi:transcriptional regulator with XRE-family HTH domain